MGMSKFSPWLAKVSTFFCLPGGVSGRMPRFPLEFACHAAGERIWHVFCSKPSLVYQRTTSTQKRKEAVHATKSGLYPGRIDGGDRDYRDVGGHVAAGSAGCPRSGATFGVREQSQADRPGHAQFRERLQGASSATLWAHLDAGGGQQGILRLGSGHPSVPGIEEYSASLSTTTTTSTIRQNAEAIAKSIAVYTCPATQPSRSMTYATSTRMPPGRGSRATISAPTVSAPGGSRTRRPTRPTRRTPRRPCWTIVSGLG